MADVTVRIKAENRTRTGFQEALNDAKKFGQDASKAAAPNFGGAVGGGEIRKTLKGLGQDLAAASTPAEAFQAVAMRIASAFGKVTAVVGGFAVGQIIAGQFQKLSEGVAASTKNLQDFSSNFAAAANATTMDQAVAGFDRLQQSVNGAKANLASLKSDFGAVVANALSGGMAFREMAAAIESMGNASTAALSGSAALQLNQAEQNASAMESGGPDAVKSLALVQQRERELAALQTRLDQAKTPQQRLDIQNAIDFTNQRFSVEDRGQLGLQQDAASKAAAKTNEMAMSNEQLLNKERQAFEELIAAQSEYKSMAIVDGQENVLISAEVYKLEAQIQESKQRQLLLQKQINTERDREQNRRQEIIDRFDRLAKDRAFTALSPDERRAELDRQMAEFQSGIASGALTPQSASEQAARLMQMFDATNQAPAGFQGSASASAFQRIGFASNEFFDTRQAPDPTKETRRAADFARQIYELLKKGEPLLLPSSS